MTQQNSGSMKPINLIRPCFHGFLLIFLTANGYILLSGGVCFWLSAQAKLSPEQAKLFNTCNETWHQGTTTMFRLLDNKFLERLQDSYRENSIKPRLTNSDNKPSHDG
jgi:hypothetical protein